VRILLVGNHWTEGPGGAETMLVLTAELLRAAGHEVVPFAVAEERTLPTLVRDRLPAAAGGGARTRFGEAWPGSGRPARTGRSPRWWTRSVPTWRTCTTCSSG
jgi:hypothetical protein